MPKRKASSQNIELDEEQKSALREAPRELPPSLRCLIPVLETILEADNDTLPPPQKVIKTHAATEYDNTTIAAKHLSIDFKHDSSHFFSLQEEHLQPPRKLAEPYATIIEHLRDSDYVSERGDESFSRTIIDLIILERLRNLKDKGSLRRLKVSAEVPLEISAKDEDSDEFIIKGRADWVLGRTNAISKGKTDAILAIVEGKSRENASMGMPQLLVYMAAVQKARSSRSNNSVFGMLSDGRESFRFAFLTGKKKFYVSEHLDWAVKQSNILAYIDTILTDAIESSPSTTPPKTKNSTIRGYQKYLARRWLFGVEFNDERIDNMDENVMKGEEEEEEEENDLVDVLLVNGKVVMQRILK